MERINDEGDVIGEYTDSEIPGDPEPHVNPDKEGDYANSELPESAEHPKHKE